MFEYFAAEGLLKIVLPKSQQNHLGRFERFTREEGREHTNRFIIIILTTIIITVHVSRVVRSIQEARSNVCRDDAQEARTTEIKMGKG